MTSDVSLVTARARRLRCGLACSLALALSMSCGGVERGGASAVDSSNGSSRVATGRARVRCGTGRAPGVLSDSTRTELLSVGCDVEVRESDEWAARPAVIAWVGDVGIVEGLSRLMGGVAGRLSLIVIHPLNRTPAEEACETALTDGVAVRRGGRWTFHNCYPDHPTALHWAACDELDGDDPCLSSELGTVRAAAEADRWDPTSIRVYQRGAELELTVERVPESGFL